MRWTALPTTVEYDGVPAAASGYGVEYLGLAPGCMSPDFEDVRAGMPGKRIEISSKRPPAV